MKAALKQAYATIMATLATFEVVRRIDKASKKGTEPKEQESRVRAPKPQSTLEKGVGTAAKAHVQQMHRQHIYNSVLFKPASKSEDNGR